MLIVSLIFGSLLGAVLALAGVTVMDLGLCEAGILYLGTALACAVYAMIRISLRSA